MRRRYKWQPLFSAVLCCAVGCKSDVAVVEIALFKDGSAIIEYVGVTEIEGYPASRLTTSSRPVSADGVTLTVTAMRCGFGRLDGGQWAGVAFEVKQEGDSYLLRTVIPVASSARWRDLVLNRQALERGEAFSREPSAGRRLLGYGIQADRDKHRCIEFSIVMPKPVKSSIVDRAGMDLGCSVGTEGDRAFCVIPLSASDRVTAIKWEVSTASPR
jgi:hypothetical protein